ncbi:protein phosphatase regulator [Candidozyma auris]|uniref:Nitrogen regulatory protein areA GATA-like domain-containing protein n=2 Tax=Candidozyma auris TaxID=498019 RepID=A0A2H0ZLT8_CANAR|nr:hypothetical protein QG37_02121 [[Candida] auris]PIS51601.1 hypothetical protein B9J08_003195 [[Candida] auris]QWW22048.1 hypothetical protein CA7LBN_000794 [[Candida] auris]
MSHQGEVFTGGATTSQHVDAEDDDHFHNTTFKLKRTRSLGLLDEFIDPSEQEKNIENSNQKQARENEGQPDVSNDTNHHSERTDVEPTSPSSAPATTPTPPFLTSPELIPHDDTDVSVEPSRHVDYLSHQWDVADICKSWRYVISRRKSVANAARLENASWRTWAQRRSGLKTISPEAVNWSKESDVTWLYGPILDDDDHDHSSDENRQASTTATNAVAGDVAIARRNPGPKPILKKRTVEDMMISHSNLRKLQIASARAEQEQKRREEAEHQKRREAAVKAGTSDRPPEYFDYNAISAKLNSQYKNFSQNNSQNNSSANLPELGSSASNASAPSSSAASQNSHPLDHDQLASQLEKITSQTSEEHAFPLQSSMARNIRSSSNPPAPKPERHIHFNEEVKQCIAIADPSVALGDDEYYDGYGEQDDENEYGHGSSESYLYENYSDDDERSQDSEEEFDDDDDDDEGGFFLKVRSPSGTNHHPGLHPVKKEDTDRSNDETEDAESISTTSSRAFKTIQLLPSTTLNYGSSDEESDDENPYTSSLSHNVGNFSNRGYDYHYDYNTVYQVDPNHAIYGTGSRDKTPDVVDVPDNIALGSNFDYEIIENEDIRNFDNAPLDVINCSRNVATSSNTERLPISLLDDSAGPQKSAPNPFANNSSDSESEEEEGLSICARHSSQSLAQQVFSGGMTSSEQKQDEPDISEHLQRKTEPSEGHVSQINPRHSSTGLSKQPHSSSSLSDQFLSTGMTKSEEPNALSDMFFNPTPNNPTKKLEPDAADKLEQRAGGATSPPLQRKASPLPPHTTSENAFSGKASPPVVRQASKSGFVFTSDSESDSESESPVSPPDGARSPDSYSSLYKVADENGLNVSSTDSEESSNSRRGKGSAMANLLGGWNKNSS